MSVIAEITTTSPKLVLYDAMAAAPDVTVDIESLDCVDPGQPVFVLWARGGDLSAFDAALRDDPTVGSLTHLDSFPDRRLYRMQFADELDVVLYPRVLEAGGAMLNHEGRGGEWYSRLRLPDRDALREFQAVCEDAGIQFELRRVYDEPVESGGSELTDAQRDAVETALDAGYFEVPRGATLAEVAGELDVSEQSASERLRRAMRHLAVNAVEKR